jgi:hypothetical protein
MEALLEPEIECVIMATAESLVATALRVAMPPNKLVKLRIKKIKLL